MRFCALLFSVLLFSGCSSFSTQFSKLKEPISGDMARVRVHANMLVKGIPNSDCVDWSKPGAGTIFGGLVGSSGYVGRSLDMPNPHFLPRKSSAEFFVTADEPVVFTLLNTPESRMNCSISVTFTPEKDRDYELLMATEAVKLGFLSEGSRCQAVLYDVTDEQVRLVELEKARACR